MPPVSLGAIPGHRLETSIRRLQQQQQEEKQQQEQSGQQQEQPATMFSSKSHINDAKQYVKAVFEPLYCSNDLHVSNRFLDDLRITVGQLSFSSGKTEDGSDHFMQPAALEAIDKQLKRNKPWAVSNANTKITIDGDSTKEWQARYIYFFFETLLNRNQNEWEPGIIAGSNWTFCEPQDGDLFGRESFEANIHWTVHAIGDLYDTDFPHSTCYIVDEAPLRNGVLSTSELLTLMSLFGTRLLAEEYHRHRIIPATVVIGSGATLRITQGYLDIKKKQIRVNMTRIVDLAAGEIKNWIEVVTVLSWLLGKPVGKTT